MQKSSPEEKSFVQETILSNMHLDGRKLLQQRNFRFNPTKQAFEVYLDYQNTPFIIITSTVKFQIYDSENQQELKKGINLKIENLLKEDFDRVAQIINDLCFQQLHVIILNNEIGNLLDYISLGVSNVLKHQIQLPLVQVYQNQIKDVPFQVHMDPSQLVKTFEDVNFPKVQTFYKIKNKWFIDALKEEEESADVIIVLSFLNKNIKSQQLLKGSITPEDIMEIFQIISSISQHSKHI